MATTIASLESIGSRHRSESLSDCYKKKNNNHHLRFLGVAALESRLPFLGTAIDQITIQSIIFDFTYFIGAFFKNNLSLIVLAEYIVTISLLDTRPISTLRVPTLESIRPLDTKQLTNATKKTFGYQI